MLTPLDFSKLDDLIDCGDGNITHIVISDRDLAAIRKEAQRIEVRQACQAIMRPPQKKKKAVNSKKFWEL